MTIAEEMNALGFASVIAVLARDHTDKGAEVGEHFSVADGSQLAVTSVETAEQAGDDAPRPASARYYPNLGVVYGTVDRAGLAGLRADSKVRSVTAAPMFSLIRPVGVAALVTPAASLTWGLTAIGAQELWDQGLDGTGVRVAHLDTGVDATHPALVDAVQDFAEIDFSGREKPGVKAWESDLTFWHGTHTAGTIAGRPVAGTVVGVAPGATLVSAMVIEGGDVVARILGGMDWALGRQVRVLSMSLGLRGVNASFLQIVDLLRDSNVLPVIAVGNEGPGTSRSPGNYPKALSVGAHDENTAVAGFSSSQRFARRSQPLVPDLVGPGVDVISAGPGGGWHELSGSSMATPHVAGLAALLLQAEPDTTVAALERAILASADRGTMDVERVNRGAVHGPRALAALRSERRAAGGR
jgi:subtilisin